MKADAWEITKKAARKERNLFMVIIVGR